MFRLLFIAASLSMMSCPVWAQYRILGFRGGYNNAGVSVSSPSLVDNEVQRRGGFAGGITYEYMTRWGLAIGVDMMYERRGFISVAEPEYLLGPPPNPVKITQRFNYGYWTVPIRATYYVGQQVFAFGSVGIVPGLMLGARQKTKHTYMDAESSKWMKGKASPSTRVGVSGWLEAGLGYRMSWAFWPYISVAYQPGLTQYRERAFDPEARLQDQVWCISLGTKLEFVKVRWRAKD